jgi:hypothetical protein
MIFTAVMLEFERADGETRIQNCYRELESCGLRGK